MNNKNIRIFRSETLREFWMYENENVLISKIFLKIIIQIAHEDIKFIEQEHISSDWR